MLNWLKSLFAWKYVGTKGSWVYYENTITSSRKANSCSPSYGPLDKRWVSGKEHDLYRMEYNTNNL